MRDKSAYCFPGKKSGECHCIGKTGLVQYRANGKQDNMNTNLLLNGLLLLALTGRGAGLLV